MTVVGPELTLSNANKCYYRVVAVDARGLRSGASDYAEAPRPFLIGIRPLRAIVGQEFSYQPRFLRSKGALLSKGEAYKAAFWDREELVFGLAKQPPWLTVDFATGKLHGTPGPECIGKENVVLRATDRRKHRAEQMFELEVVQSQTAEKGSTNR
jgi:hypothetical protein